jgi:hypothetical protein
MTGTLEIVAKSKDYPKIVLLRQCSVLLTLWLFRPIPDYRRIKVQITDQVGRKAVTNIT